jgi:hypothetical protein
MKYCKKLLKVCELRHLEKVKGNFGIGNNEIFPIEVFMKKDDSSEESP